MLSVVVASRNDDHGGNMIMRHDMFIDGLCQQAVRHRVPTELVFVDWNPPDENESLAGVLSWPEPSDYFSSRVITVPREINNTLCNSDSLNFYQMIAKNAGIRRAKYPWVLATNPDLLFTDTIFQAFAELNPEEKAFYRVFRADVERQAVPPDPLDVQLQFCMAHTAKIHNGCGIGNLHTHACGDFTMLHRQWWDDLRGYPEFHAWSIHIDSAFLVYAAALGYKEKIIQGFAYHIEHGRSWVVNPELINDYPHLELPQITSIGGFFAIPGSLHLRINDKDWGFANVDLLDVQTV
jgi:hypothetical protein